MDEFTVYVPSEVESDLTNQIKRGSGIVGQKLADGSVLIDFEGAIHGQSNIATYADKVYFAASRQAKGYPTRARMVVPAEDLSQVGTFNLRTGDLLIPTSFQAKLAKWAGWPSAGVPDHELMLSGAEVQSSTT